MRFPRRRAWSVSARAVGCTSLLSALAGALSSGCESRVVLGSECPHKSALCVRPDAVTEGSALDGGSSLGGHTTQRAKDAGDAGDEPEKPQMPLPEAGAIPNEGGHSTGPADYPRLPIANPYFERNGGVGGDLVLSNLIGTAIPVPPVTLVFADLPNWFACWFLSVSSLSSDPVGDGGTGSLSTHGDYLSFIINGTSARQTLAQPMRAGQSYSFLVDVISQSEGNNNLFLEVRGANEQCGDADVLGRSPPLTDYPDWTTTCVTFTADKSYSTLLLVPGYDVTPPSGNARLLIDNVRQVANCASALPGG